MASSWSFFLLLFILWIQIESIVLSAEKKLVRHLLTSYAEAGIVGRPVANTNDSLRVDFGLSLVQILSLSEKDQVLTTNMWPSYTWKDQLLEWDPAEFGGVSRARIPTDEIWVPDIVLYNYADTRLNESRSTLAIVNSNGSILWVPTAIYKSSCLISIKYFPFDVQHCHLRFGSWTYDGHQLDIHFFENRTAFDMSDFLNSNEWEVEMNKANRQIGHYPCCKEPYPTLVFYLTLRRKGGFFHYILVLPCVLLSVLTLVIFWIPPESPAKMQLGMNIYVAFFVLLLLLAESTPKAAASVPLLGAYFVLNMILITLSTFLAVIVVNLYMRGEKKNRAPQWLRTITVEGFGRLLCMSTELGLTEVYGIPKDKSVNSKAKNRRQKPQREKSVEVEDVPLTAVVNHGGPENNCGSKAVKRKRCQEMSPLPLHRSLQAEVREIKEQVRAYVALQDAKDERARIVSEWRQCAIVLDRFFFVIYVTTNVLALASIFPQMVCAEGCF